MAVIVNNMTKMNRNRIRRIFLLIVLPVRYLGLILTEQEIDNAECCSDRILPFHLSGLLFIEVCS